MKARVLLLLAFAIPLHARDLLVSSRFTSQVLRYDGETGAFKGVFASGNGMANPNGIAIGPDRNLYVGLGNTGVVLRYDGQTGAFLDRFVFDDPNTAADETGGLGACRAIKFGPDGNLYVAAGPNDRILRYDGATGRFLGAAATLPPSTGPVGLAIAADGTLYIGGGLDGFLHVYRDGQQLRQCSVGGAATGVAIAADGAVYVATGAGRSIVRFTGDGCSSSLFVTDLALPIYLAFDDAGNLLAGAFNDNSVVRIDPSGRNLGSFVASGSGGLSGTHDLAFVPAPETATTPRLIVPAIGRSPGAGSFFRSTMWITNPAAVEAAIRLRFRPASGFERAGAVDSDLITIPPRGSLTFADVVGDVFHATGNTIGVAIVEVADGSPIPLVTVRTFNDTPAGTYGQFIPAMPIAAAPAGESWIHGLAVNSANRTNIGLVNFGSSAITVTLSCWSSDGIRIGNDFSAVVPPSTSVQFGAKSLVPLDDVSDFAVRAAGDGASYALYASKLDNVTSDPIFITPVPARVRQWIDGVGASSGVGGAHFLSTLSVANRSAEAAHVHVDYIPRGQAVPSHSADILLAAGQSRFYTDTLAELFGADKSVGTLMLTSDVPVMAWTRTYSERGADGTTGQYIPSFGAEDLIGAGGAVLQGLSHNAAFRTNAGLFNTGQSPASVTIAAYDAGGTRLATKVYPVAAGSELALNGILIDLGIAPRSDIHLRIDSSVPDAVYAWASTVDNLSTDQTFVRAMKVR